MERSGKGSFNERWEVRERLRLPDDLRAEWDEAVRRRILRPLPFKHLGAKNTAKALSRQAPATRATLLHRLNELLVLAFSAGAPSGLDGLLDPLVLHRIFEAAGAELGGNTKWGYCTALWRMTWELRQQSAEWILIGGRSYRAQDDGDVRPVDPGLPDQVRARARAMQAEINHVQHLSVPQAVRLRTAAHAVLAAELGARLSEIALAKMSQLSFTESGLVMLLDGAHSKVGVAGREAISSETAAALTDYVKRGRPVLLRADTDEPSRGLWISEDGFDAEAQMIAAAFGRAMRHVRPGGVCCTDLRRSLQSREGQTFAEMARQARHAPGSRTGVLVYAGRNRAQAIASGIALSHLREDDVLPFPAPAPCKRKR